MNRETNFQRISYLDVAKGIAIILVVLGHAINNILSIRNMEISASFQAVKSVIYGFHMPAFFFIAGIFADRALRYDAKTFLKKRIVRYVIPYFAWTFIVVSIKVCTPALQNNQAGYRDLLLSPIVPFEEYWFLYILFFISTAYYFCMKAANSSPTKLGFFALSAVLHVINPLFPGVWILKSFCNFSIYYAAGSYFLSLVSEYGQIVRKTAVWIAVFICANMFYLSSGLYLSAASIAYWYETALAFIGIAALLSVSYQISQSETPVKSTMLFCGQESMEIYCAHQTPMGVIRLILQKIMGFRYLWLRTLLQTLFTMAACSLVFYFWPNERYLHSILFGEAKVQKREERRQNRKGI